MTGTFEKEALIGKYCNSVIVLSHSIQHEGGFWDEFYAATIDKTSGFDDRDLKVVVTGVFNSERLSNGKYVRTLYVLNVLSVGFIGEKAKSSMRSPFPILNELYVDALR